MLNCKAGYLEVLSSQDGTYCCWKRADIFTGPVCSCFNVHLKAVWPLFCMCIYLSFYKKKNKTNMHSYLTSTWFKDLNDPFGFEFVFSPWLFLCSDYTVCPLLHNLMQNRFLTTQIFFTLFPQNKKVSLELKSTQTSETHVICHFQFLLIS